MSSALTLVTAAAVAAPIVLWLAGTIPSRIANRSGPLMARLANLLAWAAFALALAVLTGHGFGPAQSLTLLSIDLPLDSGAFAIGVYVNAVTVIMLTLVSFVGALVSTYARNYMATPPRVTSTSGCC
jgi:NAD(P)H-quinone oxidoreductase subunit 5